MIQQTLAIWSLVPLPFLNPVWTFWKFSIHVLLKPGLENFEYYFASMWGECNCAVVWAFFGIAFLRDWRSNNQYCIKMLKIYVWTQVLYITWCSQLEKRLSPVFSPNNPSIECFLWKGIQGIKSLRWKDLRIPIKMPVNILYVSEWCRQSLLLIVLIFWENWLWKDLSMARKKIRAFWKSFPRALSFPMYWK